MTVVRHFTATAYVVHDGRVALHWHPKVKAWLPPGGHVEENEDPVQAVLRETEEETGLKTAVVPTGPAINLSYPVIVQPPLTIMVEDIHDPVDGYHQHIDLIYVSRPVGTPGPLNDGWVWVGREELANGTALDRDAGPKEPPPEEVRVLSHRAFALAASHRPERG